MLKMNNLFIEIGSFILMLWY